MFFNLYNCCDEYHNRLGTKFYYKVVVSSITGGRNICGLAESHAIVSVSRFVFSGISSHAKFTEAANTAAVYHVVQINQKKTAQISAIVKIWSLSVSEYNSCLLALLSAMEVLNSNSS